MSFDHYRYVPCLRWKQGEYQAVLGLSDTARSFITPLIEVPEIGYDFENQRDNKTIEKHLEPFAKRVRKKWGKEPCFVDALHLPPERMMADGNHPIIYVFERLRALKCNAVPVVGFSRNTKYKQAVRKVASEDKHGLCIRVTIEEAAKPSLSSNIDALLSATQVEAMDCDLVLDLGAPNFEPVDGFSKLVEALIKKIPNLGQWRTFTLIGSAFPSSMGEVKQGSTIKPRSEWILYKILAASLEKAGIRLPTFGDYGINHPNILMLDMRPIKPASTVRYATDDAWYIVKGPNVRDNGYGQYRQHCQTVIDSGLYSGPEFSEGDAYIKKCADGTGKTGNLTTWRNVGTNRHIEKVVQDVSNLFGSSTAA